MTDQKSNCEYRRPDRFIIHNTGRLGSGGQSLGGLGYDADGSAIDLFQPESLRTLPAKPKMLQPSGELAIATGRIRLFRGIEDVNFPLAKK